jgi:large subunit ribosomal protein L29
MTTAKTRELRDLATPDLEDRLHEEEQRLINLRFNIATRQTENTAQLSQTKREIARIRTILQEREQEA